jgi:hypothetical protein
MLTVKTSNGLEPRVVPWWWRIGKWQAYRVVPGKLATVWRWALNIIDLQKAILEFPDGVCPGLVRPIN